MRESEFPEILVCDVGEDFPMEIADCVGERGYVLLQMATGARFETHLALGGLEVATLARA